jgi:hypothetical protein
MLDELIQAAPALSAVIAALAFAVATGTFLKGVLEYKNQNTLKRFEKFAEIEQHFKEDGILDICMLLETDDPRLNSISDQERIRFLGFYEQIAIAYNSGILKPRIAHYMFGYYAIRCCNSRNFWIGLNQESSYWMLFNEFANEMQKVEASFPGNLNARKLKV